MEGDTKHVGLTDAQLAAVKDGVDPVLLQQGRDHVEEEKTVSVVQALKDHYPAAWWSVLLSCALIMEGYDLNILWAFWGQPNFIKRFGTLQPNGTYVVNANWISNIGNCGNIGTAIGLAITGYCQEKFGSKRTYLAGMFCIIAFVFMLVFANSLPMLLAAELLFNIPMGMFQTLTTAYAAEICPVKLRGLLASYVNMAWGIGIVLAAGVARGSLEINGNWAWRMPFMLQWLWPVPLIIGAFFAPESAWWLVRKGRYDEAKATLVRTAKEGYYDDKNLDGYIATMKHTDLVDKVESSQGSYKECFTGTNLRRTEIVLGCWAMQVWGGQAITGLLVVFFESAGFSTNAAFNLNLIESLMFIFGTLTSWFLLPNFGRRTIYLGGLLSVAACLLVVGVLACGEVTRGKQITQGTLLIVINFIYNASMGPLTYTISGEIPSSRVRSRTIVLGRGLYVVGGIINGQMTPRMLSATAWNWGPKSAFWWLGTNVLCTIWTFFRLPETGDFTFEELNILFANKVPTRKFKKTVIDDLEAEETKASETPAHAVDKEIGGGNEHVETVLVFENH